MEDNLKFFWKKPKDKYIENEYKLENLIDIEDESAKKIENDIKNSDKIILEVKSKKERRQYIETYKERISSCQLHVEKAKKEFIAIGEYLADIQTIEKLDEKTKSEISRLVKREIVLTGDKNASKNPQINMSEVDFNMLASLEDKMPQIIREMDEDEKDALTVKTDLNHIKGEKASLAFDKIELIKRLKLLAKSIRIAVSSDIFIAFILVYLAVYNDVDVQNLSWLVALLSAGVFAMIFVLNRKATYELVMTDKKLVKAVSLLNKYKLRYVNIKSKLDYQYEKHHVNNSYELSLKFKSYKKVKKEREKYNIATDQLYATTKDLEKLIRSMNLNDYNVWLIQRDVFVSNDKLLEIKKDLLLRKQKMKATIDYNEELIEDAKQKIKELILEKPEYAKEMLDILA